ncbi:MAG TPA: hypothetical protein VD947_02085 [Patescibacteria group bacterium]|nr:hypothetical protein [Patescibacteria group bacterium]
MNPVLIGQIAGVLAVIQVIPYIVDIFRGHTKPERMTYFIWFIVDALTISSYIAMGAKTTIWVGLVYVATGFIIFLLSLKYGMGGFSKLDVFCLLLALIGMLIWATTDNALIALCFAMLAAKIGYLPTIKKAYFFPETENTLSWTLCSFSSILNLFALTTVAPSIAIPPLLGAIFPTLVAYLLLFPIAHAKLAKRSKPTRAHNVLTHHILVR